MKTILAVSIAVFGILSLAPPAEAATYYPNVTPSAWYVLPGQRITITGSGFAPYERVWVQGPEGRVPFLGQADESGRVSLSSIVTVPYRWQGTTKAFTVHGSVSGAAATPNPIVFTIGLFYPQITPSSWWVKYGDTVHISGQGFAPGEPVRLRVNSRLAAQGVADGSGNVHFTITAPRSGTSATLMARGLFSGQASTQTISLHP